MDLRFHGDLTLEKWWLEWFGSFGRELGSEVPHNFGVNPKGVEFYNRQFTSDPQQYLRFIEWCKENKAACWITSQPMREYNIPLGIEKIFIDFDYPLEKNENMTPNKREKVKSQVIEFVNSMDYEPLIVGTRKGFHVYVFLRRIYEFEPANFEIAKEIFGVIGLTLLGMPKLYCELEEVDRNKWKYLDFGPLGDIMRMARVPLTPHEKSGTICQILNKELEPTKIKSLGLFKTYGILEDKIREAANIVKIFHQKQLTNKWKQVQTGTDQFNDENGRFQGHMRKCFTECLKVGEMKDHYQRLALLIEAWYAGFKTEEQLMDICRNFKDFKDSKSRGQVRWFLKNQINQQTQKCKTLPYRCTTIQSHGWCLKTDCQLFRE